MSNSGKKPQKPLRNLTMGDFIRNLNEKLEEAGQPLVSRPPQQKKTNGPVEFQIHFIKKPRRCNKAN